MSEKDKEEFKNALSHIAYHGMLLDSPYDRVRVSEWARKLLNMDAEDVESAKKRNEYTQFLRIQVTHSFLQAPFKDPPPDNDLTPLPELLANIICSKIPELPRAGPIAPAIVRQSPDGRAYLSIKQVPNYGVFCYMSVTPTAND